MSERNRVWDYLENLPLRLIDRATRPLPLRLRGNITAWLGRRVILIIPALRRRIERNLALIYPDMAPARRREILVATAGNIGRTLFEMRDNERLLARGGEIEITGEEGVAAIRAAADEGRGALLVSGHFGHFEAVRAALRCSGLESGAIYRPQNNRYFNADILHNFEVVGGPMCPRGRQGMREVIKHLTSGGRIAVLIDQKSRLGEVLDFMGQPAATSTAVAELALRYDLLLITGYGVRLPDGVSYRAEVETPIPHTDPIRMTQALNDSLAARVHATPENWYWLHQRWKIPEGMKKTATPAPPRR